MKFGIELEFFVGKDNKIVPAYLATNNLDGDPFIGELRTDVFDNIIDAVFDLKKKLYLETQELEKKGYELMLVPSNQFSNEDLIAFRKNGNALDKKSIEILEEFSIYPKGNLGKLLKRGFKKASLQVNISKHNKIVYTEYNKITVEDKSRWESKTKEKEYSCLFNYLDVFFRLDNAFNKEIKETSRVKGVYAIKEGTFGDRIEYRSLPNTVSLDKLMEVLK